MYTVRHGGAVIYDLLSRRHMCPRASHVLLTFYIFTRYPRTRVPISAPPHHICGGTSSTLHTSHRSTNCPNMVFTVYTRKHAKDVVETKLDTQWVVVSENTYPMFSQMLCERKHSQKHLVVYLHIETRTCHAQVFAHL